MIFSFKKFKKNKDFNLIEDFYYHLQMTDKVLTEEDSDFKIDKNYLREIKKTIDKYFYKKDRDNAYLLILALLKLNSAIIENNQNQSVKNSPSLISRLLVLLDLSLEIIFMLQATYSIEVNKEIRSAYLLFKTKELELMAKRRSLLDYIDLISIDNMITAPVVHQTEEWPRSPISKNSFLDLQYYFFDLLVALKKGFHLDWKGSYDDFFFNVQEIIAGLKINCQAITKDKVQVRFVFQNRIVIKEIELNPDDYLDKYLDELISLINQTLKELSIKAKLYQFEADLDDNYQFYLLGEYQINHCSTLLLAKRFYG